MQPQKVPVLGKAQPLVDEKYRPLGGRQPSVLLR